MLLERYFLLLSPSLMYRQRKSQEKDLTTISWYFCHSIQRKMFLFKKKSKVEDCPFVSFLSFSQPLPRKFDRTDWLTCLSSLLSDYCLRHRMLTCTFLQKTVIKILQRWKEKSKKTNLHFSSFWWNGSISITKFSIEKHFDVVSLPDSSSFA